MILSSWYLPPVKMELLWLLKELIYIMLLRLWILLLHEYYYCTNCNQTPWTQGHVLSAGGVVRAQGQSTQPWWRTLASLSPQHLPAWEDLLWLLLACINRSGVPLVFISRLPQTWISHLPLSKPFHLIPIYWEPICAQRLLSRVFTLLEINMTSSLASDLSPPSTPYITGHLVARTLPFLKWKNLF